MEYQDKDFEGLDAGHRAVVRNNQLSRDARLLFVILNSFASTKDGCFVGNDRLEFYLGCSERSIQNWLKELEAVGAVKILVTNGRNRSVEIVQKVTIQAKSNPERSCGVPRTVVHPHPAPTCDIGNRYEGIDLDNPPKAPPQGELLSFLDEGLETFKKEYPRPDFNKSTIAAVEAAWGKARKSGDNPQDILAALRRKIARMAAYKKDPRKNEFEGSFPAPVYFLVEHDRGKKNAAWKSVGPMPRSMMANKEETHEQAVARVEAEMKAKGF